MSAIRVLLVDDHSVVRAGYRALLESVEDMQVVAEADRGEQACELYAREMPDVVVMDLSMPGIGGLEAMSRIKARHPDARVLVFSMHQDSAYVEMALQSGADGYLLKSSAPETMIEAIRELHAGNTCMDPQLAGFEGGSRSGAAQGSPLSSLTTREFQIFSLLSRGKNAAEIAGEISLSPKTVANYATQIKSKLGVRHHTELVHLALQCGVIKAPPTDS